MNSNILISKDELVNFILEIKMHLIDSFEKGYENLNFSIDAFHFGYELIDGYEIEGSCKTKMMDDFSEFVKREAGLIENIEKRCDTLPITLFQKGDIEVHFYLQYRTRNIKLRAVSKELLKRYKKAL